MDTTNSVANQPRCQHCGEPATTTTQLPNGIRVPACGNEYACNERCLKSR